MCSGLEGRRRPEDIGNKGWLALWKSTVSCQLRGPSTGWGGGMWVTEILGPIGTGKVKTKKEALVAGDF